MGDKVSAARIRDYARDGLGLTDHMYWMVQKKLVAAGSIVLTKDPGTNANTMPPNHARVLVDTLEAHPRAKPTGTPLAPGIAAMIATEPTSPEDPPDPPTDPPDPPTVEDLAARDGPKSAGASSAAGGDPPPKPDPPKLDDEPEPKGERKKFKLPAGTWKYIIIIGGGCIALAAVRSWYLKRRADKSTITPAAPRTPTPEDYSPERLRADLVNQGLTP